MKTIGLLGGVSPESSLVYYKLFNQLTRERLGGFHSAKILFYSVDFHYIEHHHATGEWDICVEHMGLGAKSLEKGGADFILIGSNTMHRIAPDLQALVNIPIIHIAKATIEKIKEKNLNKIALLGTKATMTGTFYKEHLENAGIEVITPQVDDIEIINEIIFSELCKGIINPNSKKVFFEIVDKLIAQGIEGAILGCTELCLIASQEDTNLTLFDTTLIHAQKAVDLALGLDVN